MSRASGFEEQNQMTDIQQVQMTKGADFLGQGKYWEAISFLTPLAEMGNLVAKKRLALCYYHLHDFESAYEVLQEVAQSTDEKSKNWAVYFMGTIQSHWGNFSGGIQLLQSLPYNPRALINLALVYWKVYKIHKDPVALNDAELTLNQIDMASVPPIEAHKIPHLKGLLCQARGDYSTANTLYQTALNMTNTPIDVGSVLNDIAVLYMELGQLTQAAQALQKAKDVLQHEWEYERAINHKWFGLLSVLQNKPEQAQFHVEQAVSILSKLKSFGEVSHTLSLFSTSQCKSPYSLQVKNVSQTTELNIGIEFIKQGKYVKAIEALSLLAKQGNLQARQYLATCYYQLDMLDSAHEHFLFLAEQTQEPYREFGISMLAFLNIADRQLGQALQRLKTLPDTPINLIDRALVYYKKYRAQKDEFSIREALRLVKKIQLDTAFTEQTQQLFHLMGIFYQIQGEFSMAKTYYQKSLEIGSSPKELGSVLNDYASLHIERGDYENAEEILIKARELVKDRYVIEEAVNEKWSGILASLQKRYIDARSHLEKAAKVLRDRDILQELASILYVLADATRKDNFYQAAEYFADGLTFERLSEEIVERDEVLFRFYYNGFFCT